MFLFKLRVSLLISKLSLISKENVGEAFARPESSSKEGSLSQNSRWSRTALSFEGLKVIDNVLTESPVNLTVEKHLLILSLLFLGDISLQLRTKLRKSFKNISNCCKVQNVYKSQRRLSSQFRFKEPLSYDLMSKVVYKYTCRRCNSS